MLDRRLGAFELVAEEQALTAARALDRLLAAGVDLGPLMGVPIEIKDLISAEGMPTAVGSNVDVSDLVGPEGSFVKALRRAGCVILGKTKMMEFARGGDGVNISRGTPWNPWDPVVHRVPGGSSSGSGVAMAAALSGFSVATDTAGSVRTPAALCGVVGLKTTRGLWPTDGVFPLSRTLDTIGILARTVADTAVVFAALTGCPMPVARSPRGLRLGKPIAHFHEDLDPGVAAALAAVVARIEEAGVEIVPMEVPEVAERRDFYPGFVSAELIAALGRDRFERERHRMDPLVASRAAAGLEITADRYIRLLWRHRELCAIAAGRMRGLDAWIAPTTPALPASVSEILEKRETHPFPPRVGRNVWPASLFGQCAVSVPVQRDIAALPVGLQIIGPAHGEAEALSIARTVEAVIGPPPRPDLSRFMEGVNGGALGGQVAA